MSIKRIIMHWTGGNYTPSGLDQHHYHFLITGAGELVRGRFTPEDNIDCRDGRYAAHTLGLSTGSIGIAMAAMAGAQENPFNPGRCPITDKQLEAFVRHVRILANRYNIGITRFGVLSHAEVSETYGVKQRGKWDITWLPGMDKPESAISVGNRLRSLIRGE